MCKIVGYGEDSFTLWALKHRISAILKTFQDQTFSSDCLLFYRPSFGRGCGAGTAEFGEFDSILVSRENIYLIESKWDNFSEFNDDKVTIKPVQKMRHRIFSWYITHWNKKYSNDWESFIKEQTDDFQKKFPGKKIAPNNSLLAANLEFVLNILQKHCRKSGFEQYHIKNVLLFFYNAEKSKPPTKVDGVFRLIKLDYSQEISGNFITLD